jgi:TRAP-type C4-dicarboxylate transport system permease small subunit
VSLRAAAQTYFRYSRAAVQAIAVLVLAAMVAINSAEVLHRVIFTRGINWVQELSVILAMTLYFLTYALIAKDREYIRIDLVARVLPPRGQHVLAIAIRLVVLVFHLVLAAYAAKAVKFTAMFETPVLSWPEYVFYLPLALGCADIVVTELIYLVWQLRGIEIQEHRAAILT